MVVLRTMVFTILLQKNTRYVPRYVVLLVQSPEYLYCVYFRSEIDLLVWALEPLMVVKNCPQSGSRIINMQLYATCSEDKNIYSGFSRIPDSCLFNARLPTKKGIFASNSNKTQNPEVTLRNFLSQGEILSAFYYCWKERTFSYIHAELL